MVGFFQLSTKLIFVYVEATTQSLIVFIWPKLKSGALYLQELKI